MPARRHGRLRGVPVKPEEVRREIKRLEDERLHLLPAAWPRFGHEDLRRRGPGARLPRAAARHRGEDAGAAEGGRLRAQQPHAGHLPEKAGERGVPRGQNDGERGRPYRHVLAGVGVGAGVGIPAGVGLGLALGNLVLGIGFGIAVGSGLGAGIGFALARRGGDE